MFTFLRRLAGVDAEEAVKKRDEQLAALGRQGDELDKLMVKMQQARSAAVVRIESSRDETRSLKLSTSMSGEYRFKLDSDPAVAK